MQGTQDLGIMFGGLMGSVWDEISCQFEGAQAEGEVKT